jgi:hypothetical protein
VVHRLGAVRCAARPINFDGEDGGRHVHIAPPRVIVQRRTSGPKWRELRNGRRLRRRVASADSWEASSDARGVISDLGTYFVVRPLLFRLSLLLHMKL